MRVEIHLYQQAQPVVLTGVRNAYQKGDLYCLMMDGGSTEGSNVVYKFPIRHVFRIKEITE